MVIKLVYKQYMSCECVYGQFVLLGDHIKPESGHYLKINKISFFFK